MGIKRSMVFFFCLCLMNCSSSQYIIDFDESAQAQLIQLSQLNKITEGNRLEIIMEDGRYFKGFGFQANIDSCRFLVGDMNRYWKKTVPTRDIQRIRTSSKIKGGGIIIGTALAGLTFLAFKDNPNLDSVDYFLLVGGSFLVGTVVGESFRLFSLEKKAEIQFINSPDTKLEN